MEQSGDVNQVAQWLLGAGKVIVLSGAGISTESGIPDFRSAGGLWSRYSPAEYATLGAFRRDPAKVWRMLAELEQVLQASPNPAHLALAELEQAGRLSGIITQNVDGLHQAGGSRNVVEFHGSNRTLSCLSCGAAFSQFAARALGMPPRCTASSGGVACGTILKPDVVFFDEMIPPRALIEAQRMVEGADLILVVGTSCEVFPAAEIPLQVHRRGGKIVEINLEPAVGLPSDIVFAEKCSVVLPALVERVRAQLV
jgi:NAD-dependent deacetylase